jgi:hypothetical protein
MSQLKRLFKEKGRASIATTLVITSLMLSGGFYFLLQPIQAASLTNLKDTLSTSAPATATNHTIQWTQQTALKQGDTFKLSFQSSSPSIVMNGLTASDTDVLISTSSATCASGLVQQDISNSTFSATSLFTVTAASSSNTIIFTATSTALTYIATSSCVQVLIGTNAVSQASGTNQLVNPTKVAAVGTADTPSIKITFTGTPAADSGTALIAFVLHRASHCSQL